VAGPEEILAAIEQAFGPREGAPPLSLRGGDDLDAYRPPSSFDPTRDVPSDAYLDRYADGLAHLDPVSWHFYLPCFLAFAVRNAHDPSHRVIEALLWALRPPDREPSRFALLTSAQEAAVIAALEWLAFSPRSANQDFALQVLEEYWIPGA
jgi:hypothetical protein